jgi:hypothetical protein
MDKRKAGVAAACILIVVVTLAYSLYVLVLKSHRSLFENYYLNIAKNLNSDDTKTEVRGWFERDYNFTELLEWVNDVLVFDKTYNDLERYWRTDPSVIKEIGRGQCGEFGILYVSACLAHGYDSRLVVAVNVDNPNNLSGLHVWAEVNENDDWIHVDPYPKKWNTPYMYERGETGDWGDDIGSDVKIYAFEEGKCEEVTLRYLSQSPEG